MKHCFFLTKSEAEAYGDKNLSEELWFVESHSSPDPNNQLILRNKTSLWLLSILRDRKEYKRQYYLANKERHKAWRQKWYAENKELVSNWDKANPGRRRENQKRWQEANPDKMRSYRLKSC